MSRRLSSVLVFIIFLAGAWLASGWAAQASGTPKAEESSPQLVAIATERIERGRREVRVWSGDQPVELPRFTELLVAEAVGTDKELTSLAGRHVAVVPSPKRPDRWEVHCNVGWGGDPITLVANVFKVKRVLSSSHQSPLEVRVNGKVHRLKSGQILLVLG